ncbi:MAG: PIN domain-containing protein [Candidatus Aenigmatarchaeota archaeon]|nr:MAG: PIN domain-containing protein [Candidatus Aenigmarchaeota archaeon]
MTSKLVVDTHAWIEYFLGSEAGGKVAGLVENGGHEISTSVMTIAEITSTLKRRNLDADRALRTVLSLSGVFQIDTEFAAEAGVLHADVRKDVKDIGLADIFVLLTARKLGAKVVTGDPHFKGFKEAMMIR